MKLRIEKPDTHQVEYIFIKYLSNDLVILAHDRYGNQIWGKVKLRKSTNCAITEEPLSIGSLAYRPITNGYNRMQRISQTGLELLVKLALKQ